MNASLNHGSAKIYQFPAGGRAALDDGRHRVETRSPIDADALRVNEAACSDGWYHEEAIQESRPVWER